jgi:hypothetical protein
LSKGAEAKEILAREKVLIRGRGDSHRLKRVQFLERGKQFSFGVEAVKSHLRLADQAQRAANSHDALEHYRAARVLLEARSAKGR